MSTTAEVGEQIRLALSIIFMGKRKSKFFQFFKEMFTIFFFLSFILMGPFEESWLDTSMYYITTGEYNFFMEERVPEIYS